MGAATPGTGLATGCGACLQHLEPFWVSRCWIEKGWPHKTSPRSCSCMGCAKDGHGYPGMLQRQGLAGSQHSVLHIFGATC